ncbi:MAG: hypothetical protein HY048_07375 [Acidobacteria bacterium]|nr:hypothetical protein [Acidobacteriota bacterium]
MRTTVDIPNPVYRRLKTRAASEGSSVRALILRGVEQIVQGKAPPAARRVFPPAVPSKRPGSLRIDNAGIYDIIGFP